MLEIRISFTMLGNILIRNQANDFKNFISQIKI